MFSHGLQAIAAIAAAHAQIAVCVQVINALVILLLKSFSKVCLQETPLHCSTSLRPSNRGKSLASRSRIAAIAAIAAAHAQIAVRVQVINEAKHCNVG